MSAGNQLLLANKSLMLTSLDCVDFYEKEKRAVNI